MITKLKFLIYKQINKILNLNQYLFRQILKKKKKKLKTNKKIWFHKNIEYLNFKINY